MTENTQTRAPLIQPCFPPNPYRNILFCSECGAPMRYEQCNPKGANPYVAYVCLTGRRKGQCSRHRIRFTYVDSQIRHSLQNEIQLANDLYNRIDSGDMPTSYGETESQYQDKVRWLLNKLQKTNQEFQTLHTEFLLGGIEAEHYHKQKQLLMDQTRTNGQLLLESTGQIQSYRVLFTKENPWLNLYQGKSLPEVLPQKLSKSYLEKVLLSPEEKISVSFRHQDWKQKLIGIMEA